MNNRRVVVTGLGIISSLGKSVGEFWDKVVQCKSGIAPFETTGPSELRFKHAAGVKGYEPEDFGIDKKEQQSLDRFAQFGLIAARQAVESAGIEWGPSLRQRTCIITGSSIGGEGTHDEAFRELYEKGKSRIHPLTIPRIMPNAAASAISMDMGITGPALAISTACASSNHAIGQAFWMIRNGISDLAIAGGSETPLTYGFLKAWEAIRVVAPDTCRPFSKGRKGMILGEGGAMLALESLESAQKRGADIYGEILGFGMSSDAGHLTMPDPAGAQAAIRMAMEDGGLQPEQIDYINAHGTGTQANDAMEAGAIRKVFGRHADKLAVSSTKSMHGHSLGATSAFEAVATILALKNGILPPTANFTEADPECELDVVPNASRPKEIRYALSNSFAFGGLNAVLAFKKWERQ